LSFDNGIPGALVQPIGGAEQPVAVQRVAQIEYLDGSNLNTPDARV